jgi:hypothetical protein
MKNENKLIINLILLILLSFCYFIGVNYYSGGMCEYYKCIPVYGFFIQLIIFLLLVLNVMFVLGNCIYSEVE